MNSPSPGELDVLTVLWQALADARAGGQKDAESATLRLSNIHSRIAELRRGLGEAEPALTTVSTYLRNAVAKRLLEEVRLLPGGEHRATRAPTRGAFSATRSPLTAYRPGPGVTPSSVFAPTFKAIVHAYPKGDPSVGDPRIRAVADFAHAAGLPDPVVADLEKWLGKKLGSL